jgi:hypothetical protein
MLASGVADVGIAFSKAVQASRGRSNLSHHIGSAYRWLKQCMLVGEVEVPSSSLLENFS